MIMNVDFLTVNEMIRTRKRNKRRASILFVRFSVVPASLQIFGVYIGTIKMAWHTDVKYIRQYAI